LLVVVGMLFGYILFTAAAYAGIVYCERYLSTRRSAFALFQMLRTSLPWLVAMPDQLDGLPGLRPVAPSKTWHQRLQQQLMWLDRMVYSRLPGRPEFRWQVGEQQLEPISRFALAFPFLVILVLITITQLFIFFLTPLAFPIFATPVLVYYIERSAPQIGVCSYFAGEADERLLRMLARYEARYRRTMPA
jgi:hypothetical protein